MPEPWARARPFGIVPLAITLCEADAAKEGFHNLELMATVVGEPLFAAYGFTVIECVEVPKSKGVKVPGARMDKRVDANLFS